MSGVDDILKKWGPKGVEARREEVEKVIRAKVEGRAKVRSEKRGGSHVINIMHPRFAEISSFKGRDNFNVVLKNGRRVTGFYLNDLLDAINALDTWDGEGE